MLEPDRDQLEIFVDALFRHAGDKGFVAVRSFYEGADKPFRLSTANLSGGLRFLIDVAEDDARRAAQNPAPVVFCPPLAVFGNKDHAREQDLLEGLALSVECDQHPGEARTTLEDLLGPATVVVESGGTWVNGGNAGKQAAPALAADRPATGKALAALKQARDLAARLVGGDPSNKPVCHPIRWPGSWHRKAEPRLCEIEQVNADVEIELEVALARLQAAAPPEPEAKSNEHRLRRQQRLVHAGQRHHHRGELPCVAGRAGGASGRQQDARRHRGQAVARDHVGLDGAARCGALAGAI